MRLLSHLRSRLLPRLLIILPVLLLTACWPESESGSESGSEVLRLSGHTMGTSYNVTAIGSDLDSAMIADSIKNTLDRVNGSMSNWDPQSEVSTFSASGDLNPVSISDDFLTVMATADEVHSKSGGVFDVTLGPLIELWGFGPRKPGDPVPSDKAIDEALEAVGQARLLSLDETRKTLAKAQPGTGINLGAIAKGYGVDAIARALESHGVTRYMVEIGGDLVTKGANPRGEGWRIGIEKPETGSQSIQMIVPVSNRGMATSGDYRNFFEHEGKRYSHILDPLTGRPVTHRTTSVTVIAENAMLADAWATAMLVLGRERGLAVAKTHQLAVFFIERDSQTGSESYITTESPAFRAMPGDQ
ncbi:FAD:protein FMN transferase [Coralliovum pocilloporae]|uniref:FAD:protein FMN transferase n=1 Tax=Coralliovum pocilloporae TaxID=3066369 RepID=UPI003306F2E1